MSHLHEAIATRVNEWRSAGYPCETYPAISEILNFAFEDIEGGQLRYLRVAQFRALETYWYLRLILKTPKTPDLYRQLFPEMKARLIAMGISAKLFEEANYSEDELLNRLLNDQAFVRKNKLESLRETLTLDYPSYILALAMGAGKTILMGTIVATEFAMAQEYPKMPGEPTDVEFVENALIFAPGKTIIESLREIADIPFENILPPRMHKPFEASLKLTFTRDGEKSLPIVMGSQFNVVVTNTEKIRIQKPTGRKDDKQMRLNIDNREDQDAEIANLRLQAIASLPHLAVFSDEAHHTYGQKLLGKWKTNTETGELEFIEQGIKKVRRTVDYLAENTNLIVAVNTTGTPYFERQPLRDVVIWYGLGEGIKDGVLKEVARNIKVFDMDEAQSEDLVREVVTDFAENYWKVALPNGAPARLALYFPNTDAVQDLKPAVESALSSKGIDPSAVLEVNNKSTEKVKSEFYRVASDPSSPYRVLLLVNMGTEGWNCLSLFACALVRKLKSSNNFVLQAATRCLRQVPGNEVPARIYVAKGNRSILEDQLKETYGTTIQELNAEHTERVEKIIELRKPELPKLLIKKRVIRFKRKDEEKPAPLKLARPEIPFSAKGRLETWQIVETAKGETKLSRVDEEKEIYANPELLDQYTAAALLAANYHLPTPEVFSALRDAYGMEEVPEHHLENLGEQTEQQRSNYEPYEDVIDVAVALVKPEGFVPMKRDGKTVLTAQVSFAKEREHLYKVAEDFGDADAARVASFHYEGYNFDSEPETGYLEEVLNLIAKHKDTVEGVWFTGGLTDPKKTDLYAEYLGEDNRWHRYTPDFVIRRKDGKHLVVEIKKDAFRNDIEGDFQRHDKGGAAETAEGRKAVALKRWAELNPAELEYQVVFADSVPLPAGALAETRRFLRGS